MNDLLEWEKYAGDEPYRIDIRAIENSYIVFNDYKGNLNLINKVSGVWFQFSQRINGEYYFYLDNRLMNKTENFEEIKSIIVQILR
jgi:hypothetical protein